MKDPIVDTNLTPSEDEVMELLGKIVGRLEENSITLHVLVALLEEKGMLAPGELDAAVATFLRERGHEYFVDAWGSDLGEGLYEGLALRDLH
jgi:hypothetical protein